MKDEEILEGVLHLFSETGTEGGDWAFQDKRFIFPVEPLPPGMPDGPSGAFKMFYDGQGRLQTRPMLLSELPKESWSYEGLHILRDGDLLTIFDKDDPSKVVWNGVIELRHHPHFTEHASTGEWIHADQEGVDRSVWEKFFLAGYPAKLVRR